MLWKKDVLKVKYFCKNEIEVLKGGPPHPTVQSPLSFCKIIEIIDDFGFLVAILDETRLPPRTALKPQRPPPQYL